MRYKHTTQPVKHFILPENTRFCRIPTESQQMKRLTKVRRCCFILGKPSLLKRRRGMEQQRKRAQRAELHLLMMARGGRENGAQRRNPNAITLNAILYV